MFKVEFFFFFFLVVCALVGVAFLTLLERSILGYVQVRKGPNKVGYSGVFQPFADAISLFTKENIFPTMSNFLPYYFCPIIGMFLSLMAWIIYPMGMGFVDFDLGLLFFICLVGCGVYPIMGSGWFSNSSFALLGCIRAIAQSISYEVSFVIVIIGLMIMISGYNFNFFGFYQDLIWFGLVVYPFCFIWLVIMLAETNRTPFDFAEGESELVSGFNVEYSGGGFAMIFMAEYSSILFMSLVFSIVFLGSLEWLMSFEIFFVSSIFVLVRGLLPRLRYDSLMYMAWKDLLPFSLIYLWFILLILWGLDF